MRRRLLNPLNIFVDLKQIRVPAAVWQPERGKWSFTAVVAVGAAAAWITRTRPVGPVRLTEDLGVLDDGVLAVGRGHARGVGLGLHRLVVQEAADDLLAHRPVVGGEQDVGVPDGVDGHGHRQVELGEDHAQEQVALVLELEAVELVGRVLGLVLLGQVLLDAGHVPAGERDPVTLVGSGQFWWVCDALQGKHLLGRVGKTT